MKPTEPAPPDELHVLQDDHATASRGYFAQKPHILVLLLSPQASRLWDGVALLCGIRGEASCKSGTRELAALTGLSVGAVIKAKQELADLGVATWDTFPTASGDGHAIRLLDMWPSNILFFQAVRGKHPSDWGQALNDVKRSLYERSVVERSRRERMRSPNGTVKKNHEELTNEARTGQQNMFGGPPTDAPRAPAATPKPPALSTQLTQAFKQSAEQAGWMINMRNADTAIRELLALQPLPTPAEISTATQAVMASIRLPEGKQGVAWFERIPSAVRAGRAQAAKNQPIVQVIDTEPDDDDLASLPFLSM